MIHVKAFRYCFHVVVRSAAFLAALQQSVYEFVVIDFQAYHRVYLGAAFRQHFVEGFSLLYGAGKSVEYHTIGCVGVGVECVSENLYHEIVGNQMAF